MKKAFLTKLGTGADLNIALGMKADSIVITNSNDMNQLEIIAIDGVVVMAMFRTYSTGVITDESSNCSIYAGNDAKDGNAVAAPGVTLDSGCAINTAHNLYIEYGAYV